ncbi:MAG TPA: PKD domain-containing protein, partial [Thermoplasmata archaeon]|nr:PKD domain-containing protein [Thermoplasmata archaeon]
MRTDGASSILGRWRGSRAISTPTAAVAMIVVVVLVGAGGYFAFSSAKPTNTTGTTCSPASSYVCVKLLAAHDMDLLVPFKVAQAGTPIPFTAVFTRGESSQSYNINFGDGSNASTKTSTVSHTFNDPGTYLVSVTSSVAGVTHDNFQSLVEITVTPSYESSHSGSAPAVSGTLLKNSSSSSGPTGVLAPGGTVTLSGAYASAPTNPAFIPSAPSFAATGASSFAGNATTATSYQTTITYANAGIYQATFVGTATSGSSVAHQNYTWTIFVAGAGVNAAIAGSTSL